MIEDDTVAPGECYWYKVSGLSSDNSVCGHGYLAFCNNRAGNDKFFELYVDQLVLPFVSACQAEVEQMTGKVCNLIIFIVISCLF